MSDANSYGRLETYLDAGVVVQLLDDSGTTTTFTIKNAGMYAVIAAKAYVNSREIQLTRDPMLKWLTTYKPTLTKVSEAV